MKNNFGLFFFLKMPLHFWFSTCRNFSQRNCTRDAYMRYANVFFFYIYSVDTNRFWRKERAVHSVQNICLSTYDIKCTSYVFIYTHTIHTCIHRYTQSTDRRVFSTISLLSYYRFYRCKSGRYFVMTIERIENYENVILWCVYVAWMLYINMYTETYTQKCS